MKKSYIYILVTILFVVVALFGAYFIVLNRNTKSVNFDFTSDKVHNFNEKQSRFNLGYYVPIKLLGSEEDNIFVGDRLNENVYLMDTSFKIKKDLDLSSLLEKDYKDYVISDLQLRDNKLYLSIVYKENGAMLSDLVIFRINEKIELVDKEEIKIFDYESNLDTPFFTLKYFYLPEQGDNFIEINSETLDDQENLNETILLNGTILYPIRELGKLRESLGYLAEISQLPDNKITPELLKDPRYISFEKTNFELNEYGVDQERLDNSENDIQVMNMFGKNIYEEPIEINHDNIYYTSNAYVGQTKKAAFILYVENDLRSSEYKSVNERRLILVKLSQNEKYKVIDTFMPTEFLGVMNFEDKLYYFKLDRNQIKITEAK